MKKPNLSNDSKYTQGKYTPRNKEKYLGEEDIICRSSWEFEFCKFLDNNPNVLRWKSEPIAIPYVKPTTQRVHRYFPDFWLEYKDANGLLVQEIIEVKPEKETKPPSRKGRKSNKTKLYEDLTWAINQAKWQSAKSWCEQKGIRFKLVTENQLFK